MVRVVGSGVTVDLLREWGGLPILVGVVLKYRATLGKVIGM